MRIWTELNGTPPAPVDLFVYTHQHRKNKAWVDRRSEHVYEKYKCRLEELTQQASLQGTPPPKEIDVWIEVAGTRKGHIYGLWSELLYLQAGEITVVQVLRQLNGCKDMKLKN
ncbi:unnamed protein product [Trifolium pratense]|uniref:Uncharacterized protein n=1 Tax=Trifolium pratense TaxID=57577 RepID=A0ACB0JVK5_TRIPR|nr:unnamed protein product [Trifolium pratense]